MSGQGWSRGPADVAGLCAALGLHEAARTHRAAARMARGQRYAHLVRPLKPTRQRTGRTWRDQQRDGSGRWIEGWTS